MAPENLDHLVVGLDPVNLEKPYTKELDGVSTVHKSMPPNLEGKARLAHTYPALTATVINTAVPAFSYLNWFSCKTADFLSQNREMQRSIRTTRWVFPEGVAFSGRTLTKMPSSTPDKHGSLISRWLALYPPPRHTSALVGLGCRRRPGEPNPDLVHQCAFPEHNDCPASLL